MKCHQPGLNIIYPNVNDYIDSGWLSTFYNNPDKDLRETDGYSIALYTFLSSVIEQDNNYENSIIKKFGKILYYKQCIFILE